MKRLLGFVLMEKCDVREKMKNDTGSSSQIYVRTNDFENDFFNDDTTFIHDLTRFFLVFFGFERIDTDRNPILKPSLYRRPIHYRIWFSP